MKLPIFVFSDDLDIFRSIQGVEKYFEAWILDQGLEAYDSGGRIFSASTKLMPGQRLFWIFPAKVETVSLTETTDIDSEALRLKLVSYLKQFEMDEDARSVMSSEPLAEVIRTVIQLKGYSD